MAWRVHDIETQSLDIDAIAFRNPHRNHVGMGLLAHHCNAVRAVAQRTEPSYVIGVQMRVDRLDQLEVELAHEL